MSIHKSKGLEFPVCFVCGLAKSFQTRDISGHLALDIDAGIGVDYVKPDLRICSRDLRRNVIAGKMKADNLAEEMRILYVAMTRAKEKLILTGTLKEPAKRRPPFCLSVSGRSCSCPMMCCLAEGVFWICCFMHWRGTGAWTTSTARAV